MRTESGQDIRVKRKEKLHDLQSSVQPTRTKDHLYPQYRTRNRLQQPLLCCPRYRRLSQTSNEPNSQTANRICFKQKDFVYNHGFSYHSRPLDFSYCSHRLFPTSFVPTSYIYLVGLEPSTQDDCSRKDQVLNHILYTPT